MLCTGLYALFFCVKSPHSLVPRSFGFLTQTTRAYNPVRRTLYDVNYIYIYNCFGSANSSISHQLRYISTLSWIGGNVAVHIRKVDNPECKVISLIVYTYIYIYIYIYNCILKNRASGPHQYSADADMKVKL